jgi:hypothetical protein
MSDRKLLQAKDLWESLAPSMICKRFPVMKS